MNTRGRLVVVLSGLIVAALLSLVVVHTSCTPANQQAAVALAPAAGEVLCVQVVTDQQGQQICRVAADALADILPLVLAAREARERSADGGRCPVQTTPLDAGPAEAGAQAPPGMVPGANPR